MASPVFGASPVSLRSASVSDLLVSHLRVRGTINRLAEEFAALAGEPNIEEMARAFLIIAVGGHLQTFESRALASYCARLDIEQVIEDVQFAAAQLTLF